MRLGILALLMRASSGESAAGEPERELRAMSTSSSGLELELEPEMLKAQGSSSRSAGPRAQSCDHARPMRLWRCDGQSVDARTALREL